ncbi:hypothetical protein GCM10027570_22490 [Streptomonospora sediminis]
MSDPMNPVEVELAKAIVQAVVGGFVALLHKVPDLFRRSGGETEEEEARAQLDRSAAALAAAADDDRDREEVRQEGAWEALLHRLGTDGDSRVAMAELLDELRDGLSASSDHGGDGAQTVSGGNTGTTQQVQAGRDAFTAARDQNFGPRPDRRR